MIKFFKRTLVFAFLCTQALYAETISVHGFDGSIKTLEFPADTTRIVISKVVYDIVTVEGLSKFPSLHELFIGYANHQNTDFTFLLDVPNLRVLEFSNTTLLDMSFLEYVPNIRAVSVEGDIITIDNIDLSKNESIVYLEIDYYNMPSFPEIQNVPFSLQVISFPSIYSQIPSIDALQMSRGENLSFHFYRRIRDAIAPDLPNLSLSETEDRNMLRNQFF